MRDSIAAGEIVATPERETLSEASTGAVEPGSVTFPVCRAVIDEMLTVSEVEIARAMRRIAIGERWMVEGAAGVAVAGLVQAAERSEEHTSELQSLMRISYAVFCLKKKKITL